MCTAAGVVTCNTIEGFMTAAAMAVGMVFGELLRPDFLWLSFVGGSVGVAIGCALRARRGWAYLRVLHSSAPPSP